jgi:Spy/CpxP family protein refolding chaperone
MKFPNLPAQLLFVAACLAKPMSSYAQAMTPPPAERMMQHDGHGEHGGPGGHGGHGLPFLHGVTLTEAQQDRVFAITHAAEPQQREQMKIVRKSHQALKALAASGQFDESKAAALAQSGGQAMAAVALIHARSAAQIMALLTPEQRQQAAAHAQHAGHPGGPGGPGGPAGEGGAGMPRRPQ